MSEAISLAAFEPAAPTAKDDTYEKPGLTKLEWMATEIAKGLVSNANKVRWSSSDYAELSVEIAKELITCIEKCKT